MSASDSREHNPTNVAAFWDSIFSASTYSRKPEIPVLDAALNHFGDIRGKTIMEIGCGPGASALYFASLGADVIAIDISAKAISDLTEFCADHGITNVRPVCVNVLDLHTVGPVDFVFGSMILHHLEPFAQFASQLRRTLKPGGKAFFYENSAASRVLVWFRQNVVGKLWIPKHGDQDEFPLTPQEIDELRKYFHVRIIHPEMMFFVLISTYLLHHRLAATFNAIDRFFYRRRWLLRYSYRQYLLLSE
jgi:2-polyprenyl-3-methyl-5-hydroxy-6-metoxy-1,4-benzoquinol methylase